MLDARIASALNKIIQNFYFKKKVSLEEHKAQKANRFLRGRQVAHLIYDYFRVTDVGECVLDYVDLFTVVLQEMTTFTSSIKDGTTFYYRWNSSHLIIFWKVCTNVEYESLRNSRPCWICTT